MLLAIDVGNTHTVYGFYDGSSWAAVWRRATNIQDTEDELAAWLSGLCGLRQIAWEASGAVCASVVPGLNEAIGRMCRRWLDIECRFLTADPKLGIEVTYDPPSAVGADRIANALGALDRYKPPIVVVDFGTATTFDAISETGAYVGGAILPGVTMSSQALFSKAAKLPPVELIAPETAVGKNTVHSLQSGIVLGYAGAIDTLASRMANELGAARVIATGGLGKLFMGVCSSLEHYEPNLTLDGLVIAHRRLTS